MYWQIELSSEEKSYFESLCASGKGEFVAGYLMGKAHRIREAERKILKVTSEDFVPNNEK